MHLNDYWVKITKPNNSQKSVFQLSTKEIYVIYTNKYNLNVCVYGQNNTLP